MLSSFWVHFYFNQSLLDKELFYAKLPISSRCIPFGVLKKILKPNDYATSFRVITTVTFGWDLSCKLWNTDKICHSFTLALSSPRCAVNHWDKPIRMREKRQPLTFLQDPSMFHIIVWLHKLTWIDCWSNWKGGSLWYCHQTHCHVKPQPQAKDWRMWLGPRSLSSWQISKCGGGYMPSSKSFVNQPQDILFIS